MIEAGWDFEGMRNQALASQEAARKNDDNRYNVEHAAHLEQKDALMDQVRPATSAEYSFWVTGWVKQGGQLQTDWFYDRPMDSDWYVAYGDLLVPALYGALAVNIIIPEGIKDLGGDTGHNNLFLVVNGQYLGRGFHDRRARFDVRVPIFSDTVFLD